MVGHSTELASHEAGEAAVVVVVVELAVYYLNRMTKSFFNFFIAIFSKKVEKLC